MLGDFQIECHCQNHFLFRQKGSPGSFIWWQYDNTMHF